MPPPWDLSTPREPLHRLGEGRIMEYLLEVQWTDPTADRVARILSALPDEVERETAAWPGATSRAFCVLRARDLHALDRILSAISEAGASTRIITGTGPDAPPRAA